MIIVDSSALIAIFEKEPDAAVYAAAMQRADRLLISAVNVHETGIVLRARHGVMALGCMWRFLQSENDFEIVPFDEAQAREAIAAFERYGKKMNPRVPAQSRRLRRVRARQDDERPLAVQGR
jgi:ribonuclease VapC